MKQIWPTYAYSPATNVLTLTGLNIDRDQLLLVTAADRGRIMYNFADSSVTASAFTSGANTALTLVATTAGLTTTAALVIYFDDQATSSTVTGTVELGPTSLNALESITVTMGQVTVTGGLTDVQLRASAVTVGGTVTVGNSLAISSLPALAAGTAQIGSVTASISGTVPVSGTFFQGTQPVSLTTLPALVAGTAQIGSVTASISGTVPVSGTFFQATQPASLASLPALAAGTNQIGSVTASISGTVPISISSVTVGNSVTIGNFPATQAVSLASVPTHGVTLASTTVTVSALPRPTWTNFSGSVTTANTAITAISTTTRSYLLAQVTTGQMFLNIGATATSTNSVYFSAGQGFAWETSVPQGIVSIISGVTGTNYVLKEG